MNKLVVEGGVPLSGEITVQGAKNAVLPILAASIMSGESCVIHNCPWLRDVEKTGIILERLGCNLKRGTGEIYVDASDINKCRIDERLMREMRSSIIFLGAILSVCGRAEVGLPGGCPIGLRPVDLHLKALRQMGVLIEEQHGYLRCECGRLKGANIHLDFPSVGATENVMLAAVKAEGTTIITNAAREPEITDLARFLNKMGAKVNGAGSSMIVIDGVEKLHGTEYSVMPDRIVAQTYMIGALMTGGELLLNGVECAHMQAGLSALTEMGGRIKCEKNKAYIKSTGHINSVHIIKTMPYPGFPTDAQSPFMALAAIADGTSVFVENIFENRFRHVDELVRMGADIKVEGRSAVVRGVKKLYGANVEAYELRGGAALILAAMAADGRTEISGIEFIDRGYENIEGNLSRCGVRIRRIRV
ncbi:MAG: UDP-N-acetylglucosamine 1-carboxyvinyltransferase [Oscillospiraceae bacterium]|nr:UDP-N-acetylglucosamine 1-carboxyvinyltransferase [Oscillospiraceae bacterium]